jgi:hypothetical protein
VAATTARGGELTRMSMSRWMFMLVLLTGCVRPYVEPRRDGGIGVTSARLGLYTKKVVTKREPDTLIAEDGTICRVSAERYRETRVGAAAYCNWQ